MEQRPDDLTGMTQDAAREYLVAHIATLKLNEKKLAELDAQAETWKKRAELARSSGQADLVAVAEEALLRLQGERDPIAAETEELRAQIESMRRQLPGLAARERSVDPDLLEQELLMAAGRLPGDEQALKTEQDFAGLEKESGADSALAALKARMGLAPETPPETPPAEEPDHA